MLQYEQRSFLERHPIVRNWHVESLSVFCHQNNQRGFIGQNITLLRSERKVYYYRNIIAHRQHQSADKLMYCWPQCVWVFVCVFVSVLIRGELCRRESCDQVVSLRWSHSSTSVSLTVQLPLHKEIPLLFEVDVTVGAHKATGVTIFVSCFHHCPAVAQETEREM